MEVCCFRQYSIKETSQKKRIDSYSMPNSLRFGRSRVASPFSKSVVKLTSARSRRVLRTAETIE